MNVLKKAVFTVFCLVALSVIAMAGGQQNNAGMEDETLSIRFMTTDYSGDPAPVDAEIWNLVEDYTGVRVIPEFVPSTVYEDKFNIVLASGDIPEVILVNGKPASFIKAAQVGAFWELGPYLKEFPNLRDMNPVVLNNISIDGKVYGLYRARNLGRNGVIYRADWLRNVGMEAPKTIDDFYNMLYAFTYNDPDGNGVDDTYGMPVCTYNGPFLATTIWMGAPNGYGEDGSGKLVPAHETTEYLDAMKLWKKMWEEGLVNEDFPVFNCGDWTKPIIAQEAGVIADVLDGAGRWENNFIKAGIDAEIGMVGTINGRTRPTSGYSGFFAIPKDTVKTEDELRAVLSFMDKLNDPEMQDLLGWGIQDRHWVMTSDGYIDPQPVEDNNDLKTEINSTNQLLMFINSDKAHTRKTTAVRIQQTATMVENEKYVVGNPAEPIIPSSNTYAVKGATLDTLVNDGVQRFIVGDIDLAGWEAIKKEWRSTGGDDVVKEINDAYMAIK